MSGGVRYRGPVTLSLNAFNRWLEEISQFRGGPAEHIKIFGKPRVRVPVERQMPNEADL